MVTKKCSDLFSKIIFELRNCWKSDFVTKLMIINKYMSRK